MKSTARLRSFLALTGSSLLTISYSDAATRYWDGVTSAGAPGGGAGTWDTSTANWDSSLTGADVAWANANLDTAVFGGTAGTVTLGANIDVGGLTFNTTGYVLASDTGTRTLSFGTGDNNILFNNIAAASTSSGATAGLKLGGTGNFILSTSNPVTAGTLTLQYAVAGDFSTGWSGTTTINAGMTLALNGRDLSLSSTSGITLNGGGITLTNTTSAQGAFDRVSTAGITSNGGTFTYTNTAGAGIVYAETIGSVGLNRGQTNFLLTTSLIGGSAGDSQTLTLGTSGSGLTRTGATNTSAVSFGSGGGLNTADNIIKVFGATGSGSSGSTASVPIIGPWASYGTTPSAPTDYAVYDASGRVLNANISATAENSAFWISGNNVTLGGATTLTGTRTLNTLRYTGGALALGLGASNFNLETYGLLNGGSGTLTVSTTGTGALTTPTGGGNLYLTTGAAAITVSAPIKDNGGAVTVVKSGSSTLTLSGTNTFSGGLVLNAGTLASTSDANLGTGGVTVNGTVSWGAGLGTKRSITINEGGVLTLTGTTNGVYSGLLSGGGALASNVSNVFHFTNAGNSLTGQVNPNYAMFFANIGDSSNAINIGNTNGNGGFGWIGGTKTLASRVFTLNAAGNGYITANGSGALTIQQNLAISGTAGARTLNLQGSSSALNTFSGNIANGIDGGTSVVSLTKAGAGNWYLSGTNTYSGATTLTPTAPAAPLTFQGIQALSPNTSIVVTDSSSSQTLLRILDDGAGTISRTTVPVTFTPSQSSAAGITNFFVGNNNTANGGTSASTQTDSIIALGGLTIGAAQAGNIGANINVTGANGYKLQFASIAFPDLSGKNAALTYTVKLNPTSAALIVAGNVTPFASTNTNASPVLELTGTATGNEIQGNILNPSNVPTSNALKLTKTSSSTWTLGGTNSYTGTTTVSGGKLLLSSTGSLHASSAVTVSGGALGGTGTVNGTVTVSSTGGIDLRDNAIGNLTLASTLGITGAANANNLSFDLGNGTGTSDSILVTGTTSVTTANSAVINLNQLNGVAGRTATTYTLIGGAGTLDATNFAKFTLATTAAFGQTYALVNGGAGGDLQLTTTNVTAATAAAFWKGGANNWSTATNWNTDATSGVGTGAAPDYQTNVTFSTTSPSPGNLTTNVLDVDFDINSLTLTNASGNVTIGGTKTLTIEAAAVNGNALGNGIDSQKTSGTNTISSKVALASSQSWTVASGGTLTVSGVVSDFGGGYSLTKAGLGDLNLSGVNTFTGATNITAGILRLDGASALAGTSGVAITSGASLFVRSVSPTLAANQSLTLNGTGATGTGALVLSTSGTTTWNGPVSLGSDSLILQGGGTTLNIGGTVSLGANTLTVNAAASNSATISGAISGSGGLTKTGAATLILTGANTYTGTTAINAGTLSLNPTNTLGGVLLASSAVTLNQGATLQFGPTVALSSATGGYSLAAPITLTGGAGTANIRFGSTANGNDFKYVLGGSVTGQSGVAQTLALFQGGGVTNGDRQNVIISGALADGASGGTLAVTVDFAGASGVGQNAFVNLTGQSTFTGNLIVNNSKLMNAGSVYAGAWMTIGGERWIGNGTNPGSLETVGTGTLGSGGVYNGNITINTGNGTSGTGITTLSFLSSANQTLGGTISGAGNLRQDGTGTLTLTGTNGYTGTTVISSGIMQLGTGVGGGTTGKLTATSSITNNGNLTINRSNAFTQATDLGAGVAITGTGSFTQAGAGTTTLTATNTYTGATNVNAGTLLINGSTVAGSTVSVASGATLGGTGTIGGAVNVTGSLSPGASIETLGSGTLSFVNSSTLIHELDSSVATSVGSDLMKVTGNLNLVGTVGLSLADIALTDVAFNVGDIFSLINYTGSWNNGLFTFSGNELADDEVFTFGLNTWQISYNDATGGLNYLGEYAGTTDSFVNLTVMTVIPEPRTALLGALGALMLLRRRR